MKRSLPKLNPATLQNATAPVSIRPVMPRTAVALADQYGDSERTIRQLETIVSEFMVEYPSHTQRIPALRPGEHPLIAFVRAMAASMAAKQEQLEQLNRKALEAAKEKERFFASMSHEVRTPMNGIFGMVSLLLEMDLDPVQREHLETIHSSSESLLNILDDILDYAKLNAKAMPLKPRPFDLEKLVREVLMVYKANADSRNIHLFATLCEALPGSFVADDLRLKQILSNLVSNAIKFTDAGEVSVTVQGHREEGRDQLIFRVHDTGIGIDEKAGATLFAPFRQIDPETPRSHSGTGLGLGLAISKNLVELMGGRIWFESRPGAGTDFFFTIDSPSTEEETGTLVSRKALPLQETDAPCREAFSRVLLVEDNLVNQKVARLSLERLGCDVTIASNGREAVETAGGDASFDLILMDVSMPVMDGFEATVSIRRLDHRNATAPIVAMTGRVFDEDRERCFAAGMNDIIAKPFSIQDLRSCLATLRSGPECEGVALVS